MNSGCRPTSLADDDAALPRQQIATLLGESRWAEAAALIDELEQPTEGQTLQGRLARTMHAFQRHRPAVEQTLRTETAATRCSIVRDRQSNLTIAQQLPGRGNLTIGDQRDVVGEAARAAGQLAATLAGGKPIMLAGLGNGYLLAAILAQVNRLEVAQRPTVYIIEPHPEIVLHVAMIHDFSGPTGPIEAEFALWCVGPSWREQLSRLWEADVYLPLPEITLHLSAAREELKAGVAEVIAARQRAIVGPQAEIRKHYEQLTDGELAELLGPDPSRPPRIMLLTSRHTTVLQYAAASTKEAFERLGWETRLLIEPGNHQMMTPDAIVEQLAKFRPDFVFNLDHLRYEAQNLFVPQMPFICWIQDELHNLRSETAGRSINDREWVLLASRPTYVHDFNYPDEQCIDLPQLASIPEIPDDWDSDGDDIVYVSNASQTPDELRRSTLAMVGEQSVTRQLINRCCDLLIEQYNSGNAIDRPYQLLELVRQAESEVGIVLRRDWVRRQLVSALRHPFNNGLYRQQAIGWAADVAESLGLRFSLYGHGWDQHPRFARYARGPVPFGRPLEQLIRRSKINLRLEPFSCLSHQRLSHGLAAGGFFLSRRFAPEIDDERLVTFLTDHLPEVQTLKEARAAIDPQLRQPLEDIVTAVKQRYEFSDVVDPVESARISQRMGLLAPRGPALPHLDAISFNDRRSLQSCVERFINDLQQRRSILMEQRQTVIERLSYDAGLSRVLETIRQRLLNRPEPTDRDRVRCAAQTS